MKSNRRLGQQMSTWHVRWAGILFIMHLSFSVHLIAQDNHFDDPSIRFKRASPMRKACTPTEADRDPDVFRRPCFVRALVWSRQEAVHAFVKGLTGGRRDGDIKLTADRIPPNELESFKALLNVVLQPTYLPGKWTDIEFQGLSNHPVKVKTELRNGVPTFAGYERDLSAELKLRDGDGIQAAWTVGGIDLLPLTAHHQGRPPQRVLIRLRLHGGERLKLGRRPEDFTRSWKDFGAFFNRNAFHALLAKLFRVPFESLDEFLVDGFDTRYEGVRVFHGTIRSREWELHRRDHGAPRKPPHWWDEMRLLVTDSDPQYFCVQIVFGREDSIDNRTP